MSDFSNLPHYIKLLKDSYDTGADLTTLSKKEFFELYPDFNPKEYEIISREIAEDLIRLDKVRKEIKMEMDLKLYWGCICDPISKQLEEQGINLPKDKKKYVDSLKDACNTLSIIVPDSISRKNYEKANKRVGEIVQKFLDGRNNERNNN